MNRIYFHVLVLLSLVLTGCGGAGFDLAPVSGKVTLNGEPLPDAMVTFMPIGGSGSVAGPPSWGKTDAQGMYTLQTRDGEAGAVVGRHLITITTESEGGDGGEGDDVYGSGATAEKVPARYNTDSEEEFDVPKEGKEGTANFDLTSP